MGRRPLVVLAAGGTGGHLFPAQALAETMLARGWRVRLSTDERGAHYCDGFPEPVQIETVASATFARGGLVARAVVPVRIATGVLSSVWNMLRDRPDAVIGFGGYPSIPALGAAWLLRRPRILHEQNGVLGRVNRLFARRVNAVACGTWPTRLPAGVAGHHVGNPVRAAVLKRAAAPYIPPGDYPMSIVVIGGSQGARILSDVVPGAIARLPEAVREVLRVSHQARAEDRQRVTDFYRDHGIKAEVEPFFSDIPARLADAQLVVTRAGASTLADLTVIGRPAILVPLAAAIRDEQSANARGLAEGDAAIVIPESRLDPGTLATHMMAVLGNPEAAVAMAHAALTLGQPEAADHLADLVEQVAGKGADT